MVKEFIQFNRFLFEEYLPVFVVNILFIYPVIIILIWRVIGL
jgi:hypothetical protein